MNILERTTRALKAFLEAYPDASLDMRRGMDTAMLMLNCVLKDTWYQNMAEQQRAFEEERYRLRREVGTLRQQLASSQRDLATARAQARPTAPAARGAGRPQHAGRR